MIHSREEEAKSRAQAEVGRSLCGGCLPAVEKVGDGGVGVG